MRFASCSSHIWTVSCRRHWSRSPGCLAFLVRTWNQTDTDCKSFVSEAFKNTRSLCFTPRCLRCRILGHVFINPVLSFFFTYLSRDTAGMNIHFLACFLLLVHILVLCHWKKKINLTHAYFKVCRLPYFNFMWISYNMVTLCVRSQIDNKDDHSLIHSTTV